MSTPAFHMNGSYPWFQPPTPGVAEPRLGTPRSNIERKPLRQGAMISISSHKIHIFLQGTASTSATHSVPFQRGHVSSVPLPERRSSRLPPSTYSATAQSPAAHGAVSPSIFGHAHPSTTVSAPTLPTHLPRSQSANRRTSIFQHSFGETALLAAHLDAAFTSSSYSSTPRSHATPSRLHHDSPKSIARGPSPSWTTFRSEAILRRSTTCSGSRDRDELWLDSPPHLPPSHTTPHCPTPRYPPTAGPLSPRTSSLYAGRDSSQMTTPRAARTCGAATTVGGAQPARQAHPDQAPCSVARSSRTAGTATRLQHPDPTPSPGADNDSDGLHSSRAADADKDALATALGFSPVPDVRLSLTLPYAEYRAG
ncbi:hypothetical protein LTR16_002265 [Cryomyces antarcticus]|uniref:Uncharacterized protein n=1 Tax=Cryomyces antarcticus TaxID=329879 RepID=A0ABR0LYV7_9PEZI|nr:hypothetical protein LTR16_002265 [Cryomyces antarcticus]